MSTTGFMPHGSGVDWDPRLFPVYAISDATTAFAYYAIAVMLLCFSGRRRGLPRGGSFAVMWVFIVASATTHLLDVWTLWHTGTWFSGLCKAGAAVASLGAAALLLRLSPALLARERATQHSEARSAATSAFLANMSREIRTPMNGIIGLTALLLDADPTSMQRRHLTLLADAGRSLMAIVNDIPDSSTMHARTIDLEQVRLAPRGLIDGVLAMVGAEAAAKGIALESAITPGVPDWVTGDPTRLRQILLNLLTYALALTERGCVRITVSRESDDRACRLRFAVSTIGQCRLTEPDAQQRGPDPGLTVAHGLVTAMNGTIEVTTAPGADNAVWFVVPLPIAADVAPAARVAPAAAMPARRILVADDNRMNQIVIDGLLRRDGHDVVLTSDGAQALAALQTQNFDLVFMDLQMPTMDGLAATQAIRSANERINAVPIVALTANTRTQEIDMCRAAGMNDYLAKPIDPQLLRSTIAKWTPDADAPPSVRPTSNEQRTSAPLSAGPIVENEPGSSTAASIVAEILDGERRAFSEFLGMAIDVIEVDLQRIARSIQTHDVTVAAEAAHRLTGTCGSIHAARLRMVSSSIEEAARAESWSAAGGLYEELRTWVGVLKSFSGSLPK